MRFGESLERHERRAPASHVFPRSPSLLSVPRKVIVVAAREQDADKPATPSMVLGKPEMGLSICRGLEPKGSKNRGQLRRERMVFPGLNNAAVHIKNNAAELPKWGITELPGMRRAVMGDLTGLVMLLHNISVIGNFMSLLYKTTSARTSPTSTRAGTEQYHKS
jgi:hypothetical protein